MSQRLTSLQIDSLVEALILSGFYGNDLPSKPGVFTYHIVCALRGKFLKENDAIKIRRVIGRLRVIDPNGFSKKVPPGTNFITEEVRSAVEDFLKINCPIDKPIGPTDFSFMCPSELSNNLARRFVA